MTKFKDLFDLDFKVPQGFTLASKMLSVSQSAHRIAKIANDRQIENGEFATLFACNIKEWLQEIADQADIVLEAHIAQNTKNQND